MGAGVRGGDQEEIPADEIGDGGCEPGNSEEKGRGAIHSGAMNEASTKIRRN